jgi:serine/threonine-protein kinase
MSEAPGIPAGTLLAGKFRVLRCLGVGGMGAVYEIEHELTKHHRALKMLHPEMAAMPGIVERFLREASAAGRVGNPHIVETFDAGTLENGAPYLVMEYLRGEPLSSRIARGALPVLEAVDLIGQACDGIQAAHEVGIVHRDLKPDNLFITEVDARPFVKILDFGISKFDPAKTGGLALTKEGSALGTPYYMSPEQIRGSEGIDARTDVYALGVILYECVAGVRPFEADMLTQLAILIHAGQPKRLEQVRTGLPLGFADLVHGAMAADREQRVRSAADLAAGLMRFGPISFQGPRLSALPPAAMHATAAAQSLATSAAGISVRSAGLKNKSSPAPLLLGGGLAVAAGAAALVFGLRGGEPAPDSVPSSSQGQSSLTAEPLRATPTVTTPAPSTSAALAPQPAPGGAPSAPASAAPAAPPASPPATDSSAPRQQSAAGRKPRRADERGLAKENPFR